MISVYQVGPVITPRLSNDNKVQANLFFTVGKKMEIKRLVDFFEDVSMYVKMMSKQHSNDVPGDGPAWNVTVNSATQT